MRMTLIIIVLLVVGFAAWVRLAPTDPTDWHTYPIAADLPEEGGWLVRPEGGHGTAPDFDMDAGTLLTALDAVAMAEPRTTRLAGSPDEGRITYVTRSRLWGFPDYTTVQAVPLESRTTLAVHGRLRFGRSDMGVNRERVERWIAAVLESVAKTEPSG